MTPTIGIVPLNSPSQLSNQRLEGGYQLLYDVLGNQEAMMKPMAEDHIAQDGWQTTTVATVPPQPAQ